MTDRDALLRAICENPDDDAPRLIYADWLDERGDPLQAEFIRLQIELNHTSLVAAEVHALSNRQKELWRELRKWRYLLGDWREFYFPRFQRGFNTYWTGPIARFCKEIPTYWKLGPVSHVKLDFPVQVSNWTTQATRAVSCPLLGHLHELELIGPGLSNAWAKHFVLCEFSQNWRKLYLNSESLTDAICHELAASPLAAKESELLIAAPNISAHGRAIIEAAFQSRVCVTAQ